MGKKWFDEDDVEWIMNNPEESYDDDSDYYRRRRDSKKINKHVRREIINSKHEFIEE